MFIHNFKYALKTLFRDKMLIFWTFAFPIILGTFFNMAFSNIENSEKLEIINIAIVENDEFQNNELYKQAFKTLSDEKNEDRLFNTKYVTEEEAKQLLEKDEITGYMILEEDNPKVVVTTSGINETILKYVVEEITTNGQIVENLIDKEINKELSSGIYNLYNLDYKKIYENVLEKTQNQEAKITDISNNNLSYTMIEFYTLIAMTCLYGGTLGMVAINKNLANMSSNGKRVSVAPTPKGKVIFSSILASYITQLIGLTLLFIYTIFVLKVDYGTNLPLIILLGIVGSLAGLSMGLAIGTILKANENVKIGIVIAVTMLGCFLSGMMGITMKYLIDKNAPIINKINPASMITDGFYSLYYYDTLDRYYFNIISLVVFSLVMIIVSYTSLRRQKYDSI
ncbi:MAG: ABC transporter permease [Clostridia bacterium]|nr:ABC transporter permease [Clostridia bacterium]